MEITEKVAYLKGLMEGMKIDTETSEGKILSAMVDILEDIGLELEDLWNAQGELEDGLDVVSDDLEDIEEKIYDLAGIRIICQFVEDIEKVADLIQKRSDIEIKSEKDYIRHMKDSGYRSYHLIVYYTVETMNGPKRIQVEIQIRTMAMDFWATIEHSLQYKYKANIPDHIRERLSAAAKAIIVLDNEMSSVRSEIMDAQNSSQMQRNLITDILNNIENLYKVTNKREVEKIQDEFYHIYAQNDLQELKRFHKELDLIAEGYRAQAITDEL